jgi:prepilin-type N-terminal cleavage/methylation domain-containing protein
MKFSNFRVRGSQSYGFTLVELLVVMAIIAILAGVLFTAGTAAIRAALRAKAQNTANQIQTAASAYYTEYSVYPIPTTAVAGMDFYISDSNTTDWPNLIEALCGNVSPSNTSVTVTPTVPNTRGIAFLQLKASDVDYKNNIDAPVNPLPYDKVNHPYFNLAIDADYDGIVGDSGAVPAPGMPDFSKSTQGNIQYLTKGTTGGIAVWANCNTTATTTQWNPAFIVRTY